MSGHESFKQESCRLFENEIWELQSGRKGKLASSEQGIAHTNKKLIVSLLSRNSLSEMEKVAVDKSVDE